MEYDVHAVPIGQPINNIKFYVLYNGQPIPLGAIGELYIGGDGVTHGYLNNDELTNDKFVKNSQQTNQDDIIYRTGDLVRYRHDGHLEFIGRVDDQLKVRGYRIEVGEIEAQLVSHDKIKEAVVLAKGEGIKKHLVAYYTINQHAPKVSELKGWLKVSLAEYMIPTKFIEVDKFILTNNGKVDKKSLSEIAYVELGHNDKFSKNNNIEGQLSVIWCEILQLDKISINDNFFESGGNSLLSIEVQKAVSDRTGYQIELTDIFEYPTIKSLSGYLTKENELDERAVNTKSANTDSTNTGRQQDNDIAVIGMSGRFPDAANIDEFWQNISSGLESIQTFEDQQLLDCGASVSALNDPNYVKLGSLVEGMADFDAKYFSFTPREAELLDPQHRFMFECASDALEHAGYGDQSKFRDVGVFVGTSDSKYMMENLINNPEVLRNAGKMTYYGNSPGFLSTQLSYKLNLTGPSLNILTACSTALVGIHQACNSLNFNDCEMALAGGSSISLLKAKGYYFEEGGIDSLDGHCRPFDKDAQGTRAGSGAGVLLLKRLDKALADKDTIHAIIKGTAINNDAAEKVGYAAPSVGGQTDVIRKAMKKANVDASTIQYVETHGTGTSIGDPIEFRALQRAYGEQESGYCALGAVKANIGHLDTAAGAAGIIKVIQAIKNEQIPPSINFTQSNSQINFDKSPFYINTELKPWHSDNNVRRAGVSSFGVGGTNAHIIIEQAPVVEPSTSLRDTWLFPLSAMSKSALKVACDNLRNFLQQELQEGSNISLHDISYTLQLGRTKHAYSTAFACKSVEQAIKLLQNKPKIVRDKGERPSVVFMFPGQGSQYVNMAQQLYLTEPLFKTQFDLCAEKLLSISGEQLTNIIYPDAHMIQGVENDNDLLNQTHITQPALFTIEYCLARVMQSWGIEPDAMIGHSIGEYVAACLAGVFNLSDALKLVSARGRLMQKVAPGSMLSVSMTVEQLEPLLTQTGTCLAGINSVSNCVASGSDESLNRLKVLLDEQEIDYRTLHTSHAFHSKMMDVILPDFKNVIEQITLQPPTLLYVSNVTGNYITPEQVQDPQYWVEHLRGTVRFADGIETILADREFLHESKILIEVGPGISLSALAKKNPRSAEYTVVSTMRHPKEPVCDMVNLQNALGKLWGHGITVDWQAFHHEHPGRRVPLPTYPYEKVRYWVNSVKNPQRMATNKEEKLPMDQWWNLPTWKQKPLIKIDRLLKNLTSSSWLLIMDDSGVAEEVAKSLINAGQRVLRAYSGKSFSRISDDEYSLDLTNEADYLALLRAACSAAKITRVIHFASIEPVGQNDKYDIEDFWSDQESGALSALYTIKAIINAELVDDCKIDFITNDVAKISGEEIASPGKATITSLCKVAPQEYSELECHHIDVKLHHNHGKEYIVSLSQNIIGELLVPERCSSIALRGFQRWEKQYETGVIEPDMPAAKTLKDDGVYLITGGLGNIGLLLAGYISKTVKNAKLILVGRSHFPAGEDWDDIMKSQAEESICHKIDQIQIMQARGADVSVLTADVADLVQMQTLFETVEERFGAINGVIHCAGQLHGSMKALIETGKQDFEKQYSSKVNGVMVLNELLSTRQPDFCILMSSLASVLGGLGFSAYAAANIFMDAFVQRKHDLGDDSWISVNWDGWNFLSADNVDLSRNSFGMTPEEGELAFEQVLAGAYFPQLINSTGSLDYRLSQWIDKTETVHQSVLYERPELDTDYVKPTNEVEEKLVVIWQNILGIDLIGIEDHFFDLGGDSLVATRVISAIRKVFSVNESIFSIRDFFESPVIEHIAEKISVSTVDTLVEDKKTQFIEAGKVVDEGVF
ncbi:type I polyketide synthase [Colwellia psychrerythraea]|uniref:type I polyketide synthase n=1 Tax=Colwellia psychrerythraea TaxID=28229 RepID=UPI00068AE667|nr:type I polyketide synthase [Colwellia psychrerythraea]